VTGFTAKIGECGIRLVTAITRDCVDVIATRLIGFRRHPEVCRIKSARTRMRPGRRPRIDSVLAHVPVEHRASAIGFRRFERFLDI
jgi:hypothetical protein